MGIWVKKNLFLLSWRKEFGSLFFYPTEIARPFWVDLARQADIRPGYLPYPSNIVFLKMYFGGGIPRCKNARRTVRITPWKTCRSWNSAWLKNESIWLNIFFPIRRHFLRIDKQHFPWTAGAGIWVYKKTEILPFLLVVFCQNEI